MKLLLILVLQTLKPPTSAFSPFGHNGNMRLLKRSVSPSYLQQRQLPFLPKSPVLSLLVPPPSINPLEPRDHTYYDVEATCRFSFTFGATMSSNNSVDFVGGGDEWKGAESSYSMFNPNNDEQCSFNSEHFQHQTRRHPDMFARNNQCNNKSGSESEDVLVGKYGGNVKSQRSKNSEKGNRSRFETSPHVAPKFRPIQNERKPNSYLKTTMDDSILEALHKLVHEAKSSWEKMNEDLDTVDNSGDVNGQTETNNNRTDVQNQKHNPSIPRSAKSTKGPKNISIKPRSRKSLHMTYFFMGTILDQMPADELLAWNSMLKNHLTMRFEETFSQAHPSESSSQQSILPQSKADKSFRNYNLEFQSLSLFPPHRENLVVALFRSSPDLDELHEELHELAMSEKGISERNSLPDETNSFGDFDSENDGKSNVGKVEYMFPLLRGVSMAQRKQRKQQTKTPRRKYTKKSHGQQIQNVGSAGETVQPEQSDDRKQSFSPWVAHVTLGNLSGNKSDIKRFGLWLKERRYPTGGAEDFGNLLSVLDSKIEVRGLEMGGPVPTQVELDWNFPFSINPDSSHNPDVSDETEGDIKHNDESST